MGATALARPFHFLVVFGDEPAAEIGQPLTQPIEAKIKHTGGNEAQTSRAAAMALPWLTAMAIDHVVVRDFLACSHRTPCDDVSLRADTFHPGVRVAARIDVPLWRGHEDDTSMFEIVAVVRILAEFGAKWVIGVHGARVVDNEYGVALGYPLRREHAQSVNTRRGDDHFAVRCHAWRPLPATLPESCSRSRRVEQRAPARRGGPARSIRRPRAADGSAASRSAPGAVRSPVRPEAAGS